MSKYLVTFNEENMYEKLKKIAKKEKRSIGNTILLAVSNYINKEEGKIARQNIDKVRMESGGTNRIKTGVGEVGEL